MSQQAAIPPAAPRSTTGALLIALAVAVVWTIIASIAPLPVAPDGSDSGAAIFLGGLFGRIIGAGLFIGGICWAVLFFAHVRRVNANNGLRDALVIVGATLAVATVCTVAIGIPRGAMDTNAKLATFAQNYDGALDKDSRDYEVAMDALSMDKALTPAALAADPGFQATRAKLKSARETIARFQALQAKRRTDARAEVAKLSPAAATAFDRGLARSQPLVDQRWRLETQLVDEADALLDGLDGRRSGWRLSGGSIEFRSATDMAVYNAHVLNIRRLAMEEQALATTLNAKDAQAHKYIETMKRGEP